jgi:ribulose-5-phosphate 4-epimerase/fuculose-1-phosphate aldolase
MSAAELHARRRVLRNLLGMASVATLSGTFSTLIRAQNAPEMARLIAANRILANEGVVDAFGHVSIRASEARNRFVMSRSRSPALVEETDLMRFDLEGDALDGDTRRPYGERMIHAAVYAARSDVGAVIHHHAYPVLPFSITAEPLRPVIHTAAVIGAEIPVWDIRQDFGDTDLLVRDMEKGRSLARALGPNTCLLMRGHGAVVVGQTVRHAVMTAVYLQVNAEVLLASDGIGESTVLSAREIELAAATQFSPLALDRAWEYFCRRAGLDPV